MKHILHNPQKFKQRRTGTDARGLSGHRPEDGF